MEKLFMSAGIVSTIVMSLTGIVKLLFKKFKLEHCNWFKAVFTLVSLVLSIGLSVLDELYILSGELFSLEFAILVSTVIAGVFCGYNGVYEGLGLKELVKKIKESIKKAKELAEDKKVVEYLSKIESAEVDKVIKLLAEKKENVNNINEV